MKTHEVTYFKCPACEFIQTEEPFWLEQAYSSAITSLDIGLISRNLEFVPITSTIIKSFVNKNGKFIDYGGGYGLLVRMMRDEGFDFYRQDIHCENLFAKNFDITDLTGTNKFEMLFAFEVMEHLVDPVQEIKKMLEYSDTILFSTTLQPENGNVLDWWYLAPETGQHISLFSKKSLHVIAQNLGLNFETQGVYHLFSKNKIDSRLFLKCFDKKYQTELNNKSKNPPSLLVPDFNKISGNKIKI
ncbi:MAG: class I SAM-dependent methyltransferase [Bacteroidia bacterium]|nr:class I SAM-dependent methyltransferase [Bacteroidia bacterium]